MLDLEIFCLLMILNTSRIFKPKSSWLENTELTEAAL